MKRAHRLWLLLPTVPAIWLDYATTLNRQPESYWAGDWSKVHEGQPILAYFLGIHPLAFLAFGVGWTCITSTMIWVLPRTAGIALAFYLALSHLWGLWTWGITLPMSGLFMLLIQVAVGTLLAIACTKVICAEIASVNKTDNGRNAA